MFKPIPWSYSMLTSYETCPRQFYLTWVVKKIASPQTEATLWGGQVHRCLEDRVKLKTVLPPEIARWEPLAKKLDTAKGLVFTETKFTLTRNLTPTTWFGQDAWCRGIIDLGVDSGPKALLLDWKTGKVKHDSSQLKLFAALFMAAKPYVETVSTGFVWLAHDKMTRETITRPDLPAIWEDFIMRSQRLEMAYKNDRWPPKPSGLCNGWCGAGKENCEFWSPKRSK